MVKVIVGLILVGAIVLAVVYFAGGYRSLDPVKQGQQARAKIQPGMTWKQVLAAIGSPGRYYIYVKVKKTTMGVETEVIQDGAQLKFDRQVFENDVKANSMKEGFRFVYMFSPTLAFTVIFDASGMVVDVADERTDANLLQSLK